MKDNEMFTKQVMRRVYLIWLVKKITSPFVVKFTLMAIFLWQMSFYISLGNVIRNAPSMSDYGFFWSAFLNTEIFSKLFLFGIVIIAILLIRDFGLRVRHLNFKALRFRF